MCSISLDSSVARLAAPRTSARRAMLSRRFVAPTPIGMPRAAQKPEIEAPRSRVAARNAISTWGSV